MLCNKLKLNRDKTNRDMSLEQHVQNVCKTAFYHIRNIAKIRNCLTQKDNEALVHAFISSKLDNYNSLLSELPQYQIDKLQRVQNAAARLVTRTRKFDSITPVLKQLHWLPVKQRISYKILLLIFKALYGIAPRYISDLLTQYVPIRTLRSLDKCFLKV